MIFEILWHELDIFDMKHVVTVIIQGLSTLDGEELLIGISINSVEEAFKQAVMGPSSEEKDKVVDFRMRS